MSPVTLRLVVALAALLVLASQPTVSAAEAPVSRPIHIQADQLTYIKETRTYEGKGSVVVVQGPLRLEADEAVLEMDTGQVKAVGRVHLNDGLQDIHGDRLDFNVHTTKGVIFHGRLFVLEGNFTVDARVMERLEQTRFAKDLDRDLAKPRRARVHDLQGDAARQHDVRCQVHHPRILDLQLLDDLVVADPGLG